MYILRASYDLAMHFWLLEVEFQHHYPWKEHHILISEKHSHIDGCRGWVSVTLWKGGTYLASTIPLHTSNYMLESAWQVLGRLWKAHDIWESLRDPVFTESSFPDCLSEDIQTSIHGAVIPKVCTQAHVRQFFFATWSTSSNLKPSRHGNLKIQKRKFFG